MDDSLEAVHCATTEDWYDLLDESMGLKYHEVDRELFIHSQQAAKHVVFGSADRPPQVSMDLYDDCKRATENVNITWQKVRREITKSCYEGKQQPKAKCSQDSYCQSS